MSDNITQFRGEYFIRFDVRVGIWMSELNTSKVNINFVQVSTQQRRIVLVVCIFFFFFFCIAYEKAISCAKLRYLYPFDYRLSNWELSGNDDSTLEYISHESFAIRARYTLYPWIITFWLPASSQFRNN